MLLLETFTCWNIFKVVYILSYTCLIILKFHIEALLFLDLQLPRCIVENNAAYILINFG